MGDRTPTTRLGRPATLHVRTRIKRFEALTLIDMKRLVGQSTLMNPAGLLQTTNIMFSSSALNLPANSS